MSGKVTFYLKNPFNVGAVAMIKSIKKNKFLLSITFLGAGLLLSAGQVFADAAKDLMASGNETVKLTFGSGSSLVKWVVLAEVIVGGIMYMMTKNIKFLAGFAILSVFIAIGMGVAGY